MCDPVFVVEHHHDDSRGIANKHQLVGPSVTREVDHEVTAAIILQQGIPGDFSPELEDNFSELSRILAASISNFSYYHTAYIYTYTYTFTIVLHCYHHHYH